MHVRRSTLRAAVAAGALLGAATSVQAQAANYPAFETPRVETRAFNFAVADGDDMGTQLLVQWREGMSPRMHLGMDAGFGDPDGGDSYFFLGGNLGYQLATSNANMPLDVMFVAGVNAAFSDPIDIYRIPVGVSVGHRFPLEGQMAITPFAHPRLIIDHCSEDCFGADDATDFGLGFDLGVNFDLNPQAALRLSLSFANGELFEDQDSMGFGFVWHPGRARSSRR
jgi:hypothetical protein